MKNKILVSLVDKNSPEMQQLKKAIKDNDSKHMHIRYMVIFNHLEGYTNKAIAKTQNLVGHTVGTYVKAYNQNGLEGLPWVEVLVNLSFLMTIKKKSYLK
ncbi:helix-turn-helix domain-containing protein [Fusibacter sp. 3D3]|uniref:helix-turn-helix domain-containing protein n=1 Tax=Fusibacter sp. 3D3 TaxID=1048380 RepID=UPI00085348F4